MFGGDGADGANPFGAPRARAFGTQRARRERESVRRERPVRARRRERDDGDDGAGRGAGRGRRGRRRRSGGSGGGAPAANAPGGVGGASGGFGGFGASASASPFGSGTGAAARRSERWGWVGVWRRCERVRGWRGRSARARRGERESVRRARESVRDGRARGERESFRRERESFRRERESFRRERESFRRERAANGAVDAVCARRELAVRRRPIVDDRAGVRRVRGGVAELDAVAFRREGTRSVGGGVAVRWRWVQLRRVADGGARESFRRESFRRGASGIFGSDRRDLRRSARDRGVERRGIAFCAKTGHIWFRVRRRESARGGETRRHREYSCVWWRRESLRPAEAKTH